jgi:hypothetical protein
VVPLQTVETQLGETTVLTAGLDADTSRLIECLGKVRRAAPFDGAAAHDLGPDGAVLFGLLVASARNDHLLALVADQQLEPGERGRVVEDYRLAVLDEPLRVHDDLVLSANRRADLELTGLRRDDLNAQGGNRNSSIGHRTAEGVEHDAEKGHNLPVFVGWRLFCFELPRLFGGLGRATVQRRKTDGCNEAGHHGVTQWKLHGILRVGLCRD